MKVSVLIPTYNAEQYLAECLDSVLTQDFADMEILISDDHSSDQTAKVIAAFAARDSRIRWWQNPKNLGFVPNHNFCLRQAHGEYVKFLHQDDKLLSAAAISKMVNALDAHPAATLAGCRPHLTDGRSQPEIFFKRTGAYDGRRAIVTFLEQNKNVIGQPSLTLFRRRAAARGFDERFVGMLDYEMWCHLLEQGDFFYLDEILATWRVHETQQTARNQKDGSAADEALMFVNDYYAKPWLKQAATPEMLFAQIYYLRKKYGSRAEALTSAMRSQLSPRRFVRQWMKHKFLRPFQKLARKFAAQ